MKNRIKPFNIDKNAISDSGNGRVSFNKPVVITDNSEQWNGTKYDMDTFDMSSYKGKLTANHSMQIEDIIGNVFGLKKDGNKVTIDGVQFAVNENPLALFSYNMMLGGYLTDFSTETMGPWPTEEGIYKDSKLVGLSAVVTGNNKKAHVNEIALNSMNQAQARGMDVSVFKNWGLDTNNKLSENIDEANIENMKFAKITNSRDFAIVLNYKDVEGEDATITLHAGETFKVEESQKNTVEEIIKNAVAPKKEEAPKAEPVTNAATDVTAALNAALKPLTDKIEKLETDLFNKSANEPQFKNGIKLNVNGTTNKLADMDYRERHGKQINLAWDLLKKNNQAAGAELATINEFHLEQLQKEGIVSNVVSLTDMGNFVISRELLKDIEGVRSDFKPFLSRIPFQETLSLQMAWLKRNGDVNMQEVSHDPDVDGVDANLKPISEYDSVIKTSNLKEVAAVTPVCDAATRFLAVDLLGDIAAGYRTDFDRKKAQIVIARLQQAINETGYNVAYSRTSAATGLTSWVNLFNRVTEEVGDGGIYIFNTKTKGQLIKDAIEAGISGPLATVLMSGDLKPILGQDYVVVPNELMPTLNSAETKSFTVESATVTINKGIFYVDPSTIVGRTSGGLQYDLSTEASYEVSGDVRSAYQRNELVLRGSFFRGAAVKDTAKVASMSAAGVS